MVTKQPASLSSGSSAASAAAYQDLSHVLSSARVPLAPGFRFGNYGFRCVLSESAR